MEMSLRRYTELPFLIDYLQTNELVLLNPAFWDDRNDSYYIEQYAKNSDIKSVYVLCLTESPETYHHWRVFSHGSGGVCIEFDKEALLREVEKVSGLRCDYVKYCTIDQLRTKTPEPYDLPFLKRYAFIDEKEYRLFYGTKTKRGPVYRVKVPISAVRRITLSPWLTKSVVDQVKRTLKSIDGCKNIKIYKSTLIENENWKRFANGGA